MVPLWLGPVGSLADELGYALRVSARVAFIALLLAYVARPWHKLTGRGLWLMVDGKPALPWSRGRTRAFSALCLHCRVICANRSRAGSRYSDLWWLCLPMYLGHGLD